jgi:RimJ/RimL family protein N-acetyltransferase
VTDLVIRPLTAGEEHLFTSMPDPGLVGFAAYGQRYPHHTGKPGHDRYRPEWSWVALRDDTVVARAAWWAGPNDDKPLMLDWFDFTDADAATEILRTAPRTDYTMLIPPDWQENPEVKAAAEARLAAAEAAGMSVLVERHNYLWTPECGVPERPGRLRFRPVADEDDLEAAFRLVNDGSLDAHVRRNIAKSGLEASAKEEMDFLRWLPSPHEWWRLAYTPDGALAGFSIPAENFNSPIIGYIGVVPAHRGNGYAYDLLVEATHLLAGEGAKKIVASTDVTNTPMAAAFAKAGYPIYRNRIDLTW